MRDNLPRFESIDLIWIEYNLILHLLRDAKVGNAKKKHKESKKVREIRGDVQFLNAVKFMTQNLQKEKERKKRRRRRKE